MKLTPAHKELIKLLAAAAVEQFTKEQTQTKRSVTKTVPAFQHNTKGDHS
jgi:hypothetical protein